MSEERAPGARPRPRYGEYATPEEVAALRGDPPPPDPASRIPAPEERADPARVAAPVPAGAAAGDRARAASGPRRWDRPATVFLIALGVFQIVTNAPLLTDFGIQLDRLLADMGIPAWSATQAADATGWAVLAAWIVLAVLGALWAVRRLRRGRTAFWVPLAAGVLAAVILLVALGALLLGDPAYLEYVQERPAG
ncbi:DUF6264 family protein [Homoserinibacter sp. YIM 151385]|uniref:DUF6264 family protein n=1 Tax=Homoserinibacter sp. YIM 151385 TaxID=2985506 RepID=UPI0022F00757|nr:DUF6264 family protein [Homoserinibacter sp. YIM 151385]WBU38081.1 DUF6264 family protein [Homoserinibacter sp. YIM 151385]